MSDLDKYRKILDHSSNEATDELGEFLNKSSKARIPKSDRKEEIWDRIEEEISEDQKAVPIWRYIGIAASLLLIASIVFLFSKNNPPISVQVDTQLAESKTVNLPDGSKVTLNANSTIAYSEQWDRKINLNGEAFFEVIKGGDFIVSTKMGSVEVLGTSFNVFSRDSTFEVSCKTGKVKVDIPSKSFSQSITPGESLVLESDTVKKTLVSAELVGKWKSGEFHFTEQMLSNVLKEMERQFDVSLMVADSSNIEFSGYFFTDKSIEDALDMVCLPLGLTYEKINQRTYAIKEPE